MTIDPAGSLSFMGSAGRITLLKGLAILMVDVDTVVQRIIDAEKRGRKLSNKTVFRLCGFDRSVMREVFRRVRLIRETEQTLGNWLEPHAKAE